MDIQGVVFDLDDTLYDISQPFFCAYESIYGDQYDLPMQQLFLSFRRYSDERFDASQTGKISMETLYIDRIRMTMLEHGIEIDDTDALSFQRHYMEFQYQIKLSSIMTELLDTLRDRVQIGIITNGDSQHQRNKMTSLNLSPWASERNTIVSGDYPFRKPDVRIFRKMEQRLSLASENMLYVGDSFDLDIIGAYNAGWKSIWFNRRHREVPGNKKIHPTIEVDTEEDLSESIIRFIEK